MVRVMVTVMASHINTKLALCVTKKSKENCPKTCASHHKKEKAFSLSRGIIISSVCWLLDLCVDAALCGKLNGGGRGHAFEHSSGQRRG